MEENIVYYWLSNMDLGDYFCNFIEHGYDDLETIKCIGREDLDVMGINQKIDQLKILEAAKYLKIKGATWVYFLPQTKDKTQRNNINLYSTPSFERDYVDLSVHSCGKKYSDIPKYRMVNAYCTAVN